MRPQRQPEPKGSNVERALNRARQASTREILPSRELSRGDREILQKARLLTPILRGWYLVHNNPVPADFVPSPQSIYDFLAVYLEDRFGHRWVLSADSSLRFSFAPQAIPSRIVVLTEYGSTTRQQLPGGMILTIYRDPDRFPERTRTQDGIRVLSLADLIQRLKPSTRKEAPDLVRQALLSFRDWGMLSHALARSGRLTAASWLLMELQDMNLAGPIDMIHQALGESGLRPSSTGGSRTTRPPTDPSFLPETDALSRLTESWERWYRCLPADPSPSPQLPQGLIRRLASVQEQHVADVVSSLGLSGFDATRDHVVQVMTEPQRAAENVGWPVLEPAETVASTESADVLPGEMDPWSLVALHGYEDCFRLVKRTILRLLENVPLEQVLRQDLRGWFLALMGPSAQAGLISPLQLRRYRDRPLASLGVHHRTPAPTEIEPALNLLWELAAGEPHAGKRGLLVHLGLVWIHPWSGGTGRMARFLMNALRTAAGAPWCVIDADERPAYLEALHRACHEGDSLPLARLTGLLPDEG